MTQHSILQTLWALEDTLVANKLTDDERWALICAVFKALLTAK